MNLNATLTTQSQIQTTAARNSSVVKFEKDSVLYNLACIVIACIILIVNATVLFLIYSKPKLLRSLSNKIVLSLVASDLLTGVCMMLHAIPVIVPNFATPKHSSDFCFRVVVDIVTLWLQLVSMGNLCLIIAERYIVLMYPYSKDKYISKNKVLIILQLIWLLSLCYPCIQLCWVYKVLDGNFTRAEDKSIAKTDSTFSAVSIFVFVLLPVLVLFFVFLRMFREIRKFPNIDAIKKQREEKRVVIIFGIMYTMFVLFALPYFLIRLFLDLRLTSFQTMKLATQVGYVLKHFPPLLNPFIYVLNKPDFKRELHHKKETVSRYLTSKAQFTKTTSFASRRASNEAVISKLLTQENNNAYHKILLKFEKSHKYGAVQV